MRVNTDLIDLEYITTREELDALLLELEGRPLLAMDYETYADVETWGPQASALDPHTLVARLLQINWPGNAIPYVIDLRALDWPTEIRDIWLDSSVRKVCFNARFEALVTQATWGVWPDNIYCAMVLFQQIGAATGFKAGRTRGYSYGSLVRDILDTPLNKELASSDWSGELTPAQLQYAALDVGAPRNSNYTSLLLEAYTLLRNELLYTYEMPQVEDIDQAAFMEIARMEWNGLPINMNVMRSFLSTAQSELDSYKLRMSAHFDFSVDQVVDWNSGAPEVTLVVPDKITVLLNNPTALVSRIQKLLPVELDNLQQKTLETVLRELDSEDDEDGATSEEGIRDLGIQIISDLLRYKKLTKMVSTNWAALINPRTGNVHARYQTIGTSTGRMSSSSSGDTNKFNAQQISNVELIVDIEEDSLFEDN